MNDILAWTHDVFLYKSAIFFCLQQQQGHDFKTPRVEPAGSPSEWREKLPSVETEDGGATPAAELMHTVSFYRYELSYSIQYMDTNNRSLNPENPTSSSKYMYQFAQFCRKQRGGVTVTPHAKIVRNASIPSISEEDEDDEGAENEKAKDDLEQRIKKLQKEVEEQMQRRMQASKGRKKNFPLEMRSAP